MIVEYLRKYKTASRSEINRLIIDKLSDSLSGNQKRVKVGNLLTALRKEGILENEGYSGWRLLK